MNLRLDKGQIEVLDDAQADVLKQKTPAERVAMISVCNKTMRLLIDGHLRTRHHDWSDAQIDAEVIRRMTRGAK